jgi:hypothetical protein
MKKLCLLAVGALASLSALAADEFDGSRPMDCEPVAGHDCLPSASSCKSLEPEAGKRLNLHVDVANMKLKTPYRNDTLPIQSFGFNTASLVMQGTTLELVWSATIHRKTGRLTAAIADREGAYVVFGQCKLSAARSQRQVKPDLAAQPRTPAL